MQSGQLAEPAQIGPLPCAAGAFDRDEGRFRCTLAAPADIAGVTLSAGSYATVASRPGGAPAWIEGVLATPAKLGELGCAPGKVYFGINLTQCVLDDDQAIQGIWLQGGTLTGFTAREDWSISSGSLARPLDVLGVVLPPGTAIATLATVHSDTLANRVGHGTAKFRLPPGGALTLPDAHAVGPLDIDLSDAQIRVSASQPGGALTLGDRTLASGVYDRAKARWDPAP